MTYAVYMYLLLIKLIFIHLMLQTPCTFYINKHSLFAVTLTYTVQARKMAKKKMLKVRDTFTKLI